MMEYLTLGALVLIVVAIVGIALLIALADYIITALSLHKISKKAGRTLGWLAWLPLFSGLPQIFVLADVADDKPFRLFGGKITIKNRTTSFVVFGIIYFLYSAFSGCASLFTNLGDVEFWQEHFSSEVALTISIGLLITALIAVVIGAVASFVFACFRYVYLRDTIELFCPGEDSCKTTAILVTLGSFLLSPLVFSIYLLVLSKKDIPAQADIPVQDEQ